MIREHHGVNAQRSNQPNETSRGHAAPRVSRLCSLVFGFTEGCPPPRACNGNWTLLLHSLVMASASSLLWRCCSSETTRRATTAKSGCPLVPNFTLVLIARRRPGSCIAFPLCLSIQVTHASTVERSRRVHYAKRLTLQTSHMTSS